MDKKQEIEIGFHFGCLTIPIIEQLNDQGFTLANKDAEYYQKLADSICSLKVAGLLLDTAIFSAERKLLKLIVDNCFPIERS